MEVTLKSIIIDNENQELDKALKRIYKKYGANLSAFFRDVEKELTHKSQDYPNANVLKQSDLDRSR